jgi:hypothetical protein
MIVLKNLSKRYLNYIYPHYSKSNRTSSLWIWIWLLIISFSCQPVFADTGETLLLDLFNHSKSKVKYIAPSQEHFQNARNLFQQMLTQPVDKSDMDKLWSELGYKLNEVILNDETLWALSPDAQNTKSYGFFIFRANSSMPLIIQAPHRYFDYHTGHIAMRLFLENGAKACAWNTVHRTNVDFGKEKTSFFHALTLAAAETNPSMSILQLHGFGKKSNREPLVDDVILSNGVFQPSEKLYDISQCLSRNKTIRVAIFPLHVFQLGGTRNVAAKAFKQRNLDNFFHVEMSKIFRERLRDKQGLRTVFVHCFINEK